MGYLTAIDRFVFWMFFLLCVVVSLHQAYATVYEKLEIWPLRGIYLRLLELWGRTFLMPIIFSYFISTMDFGERSLRIFMYSMIAIISAAIFVRECFGVRSAYYHAIETLMEKVNRPGITTKEISMAEILALNVYLFQHWSTDIMRISDTLARDEKLHFEKPTSIAIKNFSSLRKFMHTGGKAHKNSISLRNASTASASTSASAATSNQMMMSSMEMTELDFQQSFSGESRSVPLAGPHVNNHNEHDSGLHQRRGAHPVHQLQREAEGSHGVVLNPLMRPSQAPTSVVTNSTAVAPAVVVSSPRESLQHRMSTAVDSDDE